MEILMGGKPFLNRHSALGQGQRWHYEQFSGRFVNRLWG
jgi:hypothetical protein